MSRNRANYGCDFSRKFEVINYPVYTDDKGLKVIDLDFKLVSDEDNLKQALYNRLMTHFGEFELFQYYHFFNLAYDYFMTTDIPKALIGMRLATIECLDAEPFVEEVIDVEVVQGKDKRSFIIKIHIIVVGGEEFDIAFILRNDMTMDWIEESETEFYEE